MLKERTRFQHEIEFLTEAAYGSSGKLALSEAEQAKISHIQGRILWPALGFPAVIDPTASESTNLFPEGDATDAYACCFYVTVKTYQKKRQRNTSGVSRGK